MTFLIFNHHSLKSISIQAKVMFQLFEKKKKKQFDLSLSIHLPSLIFLHYKQKYQGSLMTENNPQSANNINEFNRFLNNNTGFIHQKYDKYYEDPFPISELTSQSYLQKSLKFIYDIFSFQKYEANPKLNTVLRKGLTENIQNFTQANIKDPSKSVYFTKDEAIRLLKYCIENNDMFAVQYDKRNKKKNETKEKVKQPQKQPAKQQQKEEAKQEQKSQSNLEESASNELPEETPKPQDNVEHENQPENIPTPKTKKSQIKQGKQKVSDEMRCINQFDQNLPASPKYQNMQLIRKQLKNIFDFYCKQQQNITPNSTFDIINHKCQTMNLGKFLFFAVAANIIQSKDKAYSEARLDKKTAISMFKRLAQGQRQIDFKVFMSIMQEIQKNDENIYMRMGLGEEGIKGNSKIIQNFKYFNLPFSTRDQTGRQTTPHGRIFVPKLTTHSGKIEESLKEQLILRKERFYLESNDKMRAESKTIFRSKASPKGPGNTMEDSKQISKFTLKLVESNEDEPENLKFLSKLITHEQNDQIFLKDYYIPQKKSSTSNKQRGPSVTFQQGGRYTKQESIQALDKQFVKNPGSFTSRPVKDQLVLPLIKQKKNEGMLTQRRSLGVQKRHGYKL